MSDAERGPNGFPYISKNTSFGTWENGEFRITLQRQDGEALPVNLTREQMEGFRNALNDHLERSEKGDDSE